MRAVGWLLIVAGGVLAAYAAWLLWGTGVQTAAAQRQLVADFPAAGAPVPLDGAGSASPTPPRTTGRVREPGTSPTADGAGGRMPFDPTFDTGPAAAGAVPEGEAVALLGFSRPGGTAAPVAAGWVAVVEGTSAGALRRGPGHYPASALPGAGGNFAVAGHRTTYGAPFGDLAELRAGDRVHAVGLDGVQHDYRVVRLQVVDPTETWVVGQDPLGTGRPTLTLTTCHPRYSAAQRLVVFATLVASGT